MRSDKDGFDYWEYQTYELLQIVPTTDFEYVFCDHKADGKDAKLDVAPLDALAVARVTTHYVRRLSNTAQSYASGKQWHEPDVETAVVGLELAGGYWQVVQEADNFAGMMRKGGKPADAMNYLRAEYRDMLKAASAK